MERSPCFVSPPPFFGNIKMLSLFTPGQQADSKALLNWECYAALKETGRAKPTQTLPFFLVSGGCIKSNSAGLGPEPPVVC